MNQSLFKDAEQIAAQAHLTTRAEQSLIVEVNDISKVLSEFPALLRFIPPARLEAGIARLLNIGPALNATQSNALARDILANPYQGGAPQVAQPSASSLAAASTSTPNVANLLTTLTHQT